MSTKLNEKTARTEKIIHIMVTSLCNRNCKYCCNKQYDLNTIPYVTDEELRNADTICITGGEPFLFTNPSEIAAYYKLRFKNIKNVYVYTNAFELANYLLSYPEEDMSYIDGVSVSIKHERDIPAFNDLVSDERIKEMTSNRLYLFDIGKTVYLSSNFKSFVVILREWQEDFKPANNSIFRRV